MKKTSEPTISIRLNPIESEGLGKIDQTVNVTINGETLVITRGERVDLPISYYAVLKESGRFPEL